MPSQLTQSSIAGGVRKAITRHRYRREQTQDKYQGIHEDGEGKGDRSIAEEWHQGFFPGCARGDHAEIGAMRHVGQSRLHSRFAVYMIRYNTSTSFRGK